MSEAARVLAPLGYPEAFASVSELARAQALTWAAAGLKADRRRKELCARAMLLAKRESAFERALLRGAAAFYLAKDARARAEFVKAARLRPGRPEPRRWLAQVALRAGDPAGALRQVDGDRGGRGLCLRAEALLKLGRNEEAVASATRCLSVEPRRLWAYVVRSEARRALRRFDDAVSDLDALARADRSPWALALRGRTQFNFGDKARALADLKRALRLEPAFAEGWAFYGEALRRLGRYREALRALDRAVALAPGLGRARAWRGACLRRLGRFREAAAELSRNLREGERDNEFSWALAERGKALLLAGDHRGALRDMDAASRRDPKHGFLDPGEDSRRVLEALGKAPGALAWKGETLLRLGRPEEALACLDAGSRRGRVRAWRAAALRALGRDDEALAELGRALALDPSFAHAYGWRAELLRQRGAHAAAIRDLDRLIARDDRSAWAYAWRGEGLLKSGGSRVLAERDLEVAVNLDGSYADAWAWLAEARRRGGRLEAALAAAEKALALRGDRALAYLIRSLVWGSLGKPGRQVTDFRKARAHGLPA